MSMFSSPRVLTPEVSRMLALAAAWYGPVRRLRPGRARGAVGGWSALRPRLLDEAALRALADGPRVLSVSWS